MAQIVRETCNAIWEEMKEAYMPCPNKDLWMNTARRFEEGWNFPHCIGALDGKHIVIQAPPNSGSQLHNYTLKNGGTRQEKFCTHRYTFEECSLKSTILVFKRSEVNLLTNRKGTK